MDKDLGKLQDVIASLLWQLGGGTEEVLTGAEEAYGAVPVADVENVLQVVTDILYPLEGGASI